MAFFENSTQSRKQEHLDICQAENVASETSAGFETVELPHIALPEIDFADISIEAEFLEKKYSAPFLVSSMTGGSPEGERINEILARFAETNNIPMGVGSQRVAIENKSANFFSIRKIAPKAALWANIGAVQLNYGVTIDDIKWIVDNLEAEALILHANVIQEAIQEEGDRNFSNLFEKIVRLRKEISVPIILKETGCGLDIKTARRAIEAGVDALDVAGRGGTHWGFIEGLRSRDRQELGVMFRDWGISTVTSLKNIRRELGNTLPLISSGGVKNGLDVAKSLYLGADFAGMAMEFLKHASGGEKALQEFYNLQCEALRIALLCTSSRNIKELQKHV